MAHKRINAIENICNDIFEDKTLSGRGAFTDEVNGGSYEVIYQAYLRIWQALSDIEAICDV